jgi:hypothetical protein
MAIKILSNSTKNYFKLRSLNQQYSQSQSTNSNIYSLIKLLKIQIYDE